MLNALSHAESLCAAGFRRGKREDEWMLPCLLYCPESHPGRMA